MGEKERISLTQSSLHTAIASLRGVSKYYGQVLAADDLNLEIAKGEFLTLLGPSGCGKTTLGKSILQLVRPTSGEVRYVPVELANASTWIDTRTSFPEDNDNELVSPELYRCSQS